jgi:hypothetical protein
MTKKRDPNQTLTLKNKGDIFDIIKKSRETSENTETINFLCDKAEGYLKSEFGIRKLPETAYTLYPDTTDNILSNLEMEELRQIAEKYLKIRKEDLLRIKEAAQRNDREQEIAIMKSRGGDTPLKIAQDWFTSVIGIPWESVIEEQLTPEQIGDIAELKRIARLNLERREEENLIK